MSPIKCPDCEGHGTMTDGERTCPDCRGFCHVHCRACASGLSPAVVVIDGTPLCEECAHETAGIEMGELTDALLRSLSLVRASKHVGFAPAKVLSTARGFNPAVKW